VARAKRTDRAEARRRSRALSAPRPEQDAEDDDGLEEPGSAAAAPPARSAASAAGAPRPGFGSSLRGSFRPIDIRGDVRALPRLLRNRAFLAPAVASGAAAILFMLAPNPTTQIFYQYFSYQAPIGALLVAGFFAPRASWLIGAILGVLSIVFQLPLLAGFAPVDVVSFMVSGALYGALFAAMSSWYRRFLSGMNPNRNRPASTSSRRPDGKIPRKPEQRPMLARRR